jgi:hypothetical protein
MSDGSFAEKRFMAEGSFQRIPYLIVFDEVSAFKDTYGGAIGKVAVEAMHLRPDVPSDSVVIFSHPIGGGSWLPLVSNLARMGVHTIYRILPGWHRIVVPNWPPTPSATPAKSWATRRSILAAGQEAARKACSTRQRRRIRA